MNGATVNRAPLPTAFSDPVRGLKWFRVSSLGHHTLVGNQIVDDAS